MNNVSELVGKLITALLWINIIVPFFCFIFPSGYVMMVLIPLNVIILGSYKTIEKNSLLINGMLMTSKFAKNINKKLAGC